MIQDEMPSLPWTTPPSELAKRRDLRDLNICRYVHYYVPHPAQTMTCPAS